MGDPEAPPGDVVASMKEIPARLLIWPGSWCAPFLRLYTDHLLNRQAQLNLYFAHLLHKIRRRFDAQPGWVTRV